MTANSTSGLPPSSLAPPIIVSSRDFNRLESLLDSPALRRHPAAIALMQELSRAQVLAPEQMPGTVVTMNSRVEFEEELSGERHTLTLVYPNEASVDTGRISILAPVGSALLGLSPGQIIDWSAPDGRKLRLRVTAVHYQPEANSDFNR
ncbi:nucleoside diphosphate kinase regulator [Pseudoxanthomonas gei]|uniref:Nucleoside diphosphate kinase regulator n=1 Tax=Pseudoxanthomonas gei TaxID=1383030 RepID=A0ABX0AGT8_9GAMM|nr:nucleoside diphosphate kinase regulator [Pseudoxanthomonas gei]